MLQRLQRKRAAVEKEVSRVPGAPKTSKDVFQLCRGFERAFSYTVDVSCLPPTSRLPNGCPCFGTAARPAVRPGPALRRGLLVVYRHGRPNARALRATWPGPHRRTRRDRRRACRCAQSTDYAGYIRRAFASEGLQGAVQRLPLERNFKLDHVKEARARPSRPGAGAPSLGFALRACREVSHRGGGGGRPGACAQAGPTWTVGHWRRAACAAGSAVAWGLMCR